MSSKKNEFRIEINGLDIPEDIAKSIEKDIVKVVFNRLAEIDLKGSCVIEDLPEQLAASLGGRLGGAQLRIQ